MIPTVSVRSPNAPLLDADRRTRGVVSWNIDEGFYRNDYPDEEDEESDFEGWYHYHVLLNRMILIKTSDSEFYDERDDSEEEEDYDHDAPWRHWLPKANPEPFLVSRVRGCLLSMYIKPNFTSIMSILKG